MSQRSGLRIKSLLFLITFSSIFVLICCLALLSAQSARSVLQGIVTDPAGFSVPGVEVLITEKTTGVSHRVLTTESGVYRAPYLPPGTYRVSASLQGFKTAVAEDVVLLLSQALAVDLALEVGEITEVVLVSSAAPLLEARSPELGTNAIEKEVHSWPILVNGTPRFRGCTIAGT